jgi:predicted  nucleic acid-binding Zn-ribbon protein
VLEGLQRLVELQRLDDELGADEREHARLPELRKGCEERRSGCDLALAEARQALADAELAQRRAESGLQDQEALLHKLEGQQFQVKSNEAYTALLHEIERVTQAISESETRILEAMDAIETGRAELGRVEREAQAARARADEEERALGAREMLLTQEIARLRGERAALCARIDPAVLARYAKVAARRSPAVVIVSNEMCLGCRVNIPPQLYIEILRGEAIISCNNCQRVLIHQERVAAGGP